MYSMYSTYSIRTLTRFWSSCIVLRVRIKIRFDLVYINWRGAAHVACSVIIFFFEFCLQIVSQDIYEGGGGGATFTCGQLGCADGLSYEMLLQQTRTKIYKSLYTNFFKII